MYHSFLFRKSEFVSFSEQHFYPLLVIFLIGFFIIIISKKFLVEKDQWRILFYLSLTPLLGYLIMLTAVIYEGSFNLQEDLPIHLCRFLAFASPIIVLKKSRFWMGVIYFWIVAGTLNAIVTPEIENGYPHWNYFSYWLMHGFLMLIPIYIVIVLDIRFKKIDIWNAFWIANIYVIFSIIINYLLGSNYMYTMHKPQVTTLLSYLGEWPIYLISVQLMGLFLFWVVYLPFVILRKMGFD